MQQLYQIKSEYANLYRQVEMNLIHYLPMKHLDIFQALKKDIAAKTFIDGKLPCEAALCKRFGVARETLRRALRELVKQDLVSTRNGVGTFVTRRGARTSGSLGLLIPDLSEVAYFARLKDELVRIARRVGYSIAFETVHASSLREATDSIRRKARELAVRHVEGVIFRPLLDLRADKANHEVVRIFRNAGVPVVLVDSDIAGPGDRSDCDLVAVNNINAGRRIASHLLAHKYTRIAYLMPSHGLGPNANWRNRLFGVAGEIALHGLSSGVQTLTLDPTNIATLRKALDNPCRIDAIVCGNDETALRLLASLQRIGMRVPEDIAVVGFDDMPLAATSIPPLTTIRQPTGEIARTALRTLLARIRYPNAAPREINVSAKLIVRQSTTPNPPD